MIEEKDYKLGVSILEAEVSKLTKDNDKLEEEIEENGDEIEGLEIELSEFKTREEELEERLEFYEKTIPSIYSLADVDRLHRLLKLVPTITEEQLQGLGV